MGKVTFNISMSLDGFVAGPNDEVDAIFAWYGRGDTDYVLAGSGMAFRISQASADLLDDATRRVGAMVTGRRNFNLASGWDDRPPLGVPTFVVTHEPPQEWVNRASHFTFVTDGIERAIAQAREAAGGKDVCISTPSILQQALRAGLVDEITIDLVPILLGEGVSLFGDLGPEPINLECTGATEGIGVTHLRYRVVK